MKDPMMSRFILNIAQRRLARRTAFLACLLAASHGCAQVSPRRHLSSQASAAATNKLTANNSHHPHQPVSQMQAAAMTAAPNIQPAYIEPAGGQAAAGSSAVVPVSHNEASIGRLGDPNCLPPAAVDPSCAPQGLYTDYAMVEQGPVPPYWNDQEYIYDGGDREPAVQLTQEWEVQGLNSEDTIAHYETIDGKLCVVATNRVPIYAPRFGAVRKVTAPILAARAVGAERVVEPTAAVVKASRDLAGDVVMPVGPKRHDAVKLIDGLRDRTRGVPAEKITPLASLTNFQAAMLKLEGLGTSVRREDLLAIIGEYMVNARTWTNVDAIAVSLGGVQAVEVRDAKQVQDVHVFETEPGKCSLRICKAASESIANPGDTITFTIRFDNIGDKPIGNLIILDSLTTRLEYIDGSQQSILSLASQKSLDQKGAVKFSTAENEAGSTVLKWEADLPLETGDSGVITFRCRVR